MILGRLHGALTRRAAVATLLATAMITAGLGVGCRGDGEYPPPGGDPVVGDQAGDASEWPAELVEFIRAGTVAMADDPVHGVIPFWAPGAVVDDRCCTGRRVEGRAAIHDLLSDVFGEARVSMAVGDIYLDADGSITPVRLDRIGYPPAVLVFRQSIGPLGIEHHQNLVSASTFPASSPSHASAAETARGLASRYLETWSGDDPEAILALYATDTVVRDTLAGEVLAGRDALAAQMNGQHDLASAQRGALPTAPDDSSVVYWMGYRPGRVDELVILHQTGDGAGCPGRGAVAMRFVDGLIASERRYYEAETLRRCVPVDELPTGWWTELEVPVAPEQRITGSITSSAGAIEVRNGTRKLEDVIRWALSRFEVAGLAAPPVRTVSFARYTEVCEDRTGAFVPLRAGASEIVICREEHHVCLDHRCDSFTLDGRQTVLHEFAHAWLDAHVDAAARAAFLAHVDLDDWRAPDSVWEQRGLEHATETLMWGLIDTPIGLWRLNFPRPDQLAAGYRLLTGSDPLSGQVKLAYRHEPDLIDRLLDNRLH